MKRKTTLKAPTATPRVEGERFFSSPWIGEGMGEAEAAAFRKKLADDAPVRPPVKLTGDVALAGIRTARTVLVVGWDSQDADSRDRTLGDVWLALESLAYLNGVPLALRPAHRPSTVKDALAWLLDAEAVVRSMTPKPTHNDDYTRVNWFGIDYMFVLGNQSNVVKALWMEWEQTGYGLHVTTIRDKIESEEAEFRMDKCFRDNRAFGTMIQRRGKGMFALVAPPSDRKSP